MDIALINQRLRESGIKITILQRKDWLYLRAVLPPKPGSHKVKPYRQEITRPRLGLPATTQGVKAAEKMAVALWGSLIDKTFSWETWLGKPAKETRTVQEWVSAFREQWLSHGKTSETTWKRHLQRAYNRLSQDEPLTDDTLLTALLTITPGTRERKRTVGYFQRLAEFAEISIDLSPYRGDYATGRSEVPRDLPEDSIIIDCWNKIPNPQWRWVFGVVAAFGVRPHEAFFLRPTADPLIWDVLDGKTGPRQTSALYPEWVKEWDLTNGEPPNLTYAEFREYGSRTAHQFSRYKVPFLPYELRHAYAVRCIKFDIPVSIAARMMGHSVTVHTKTYQRWNSSRQRVVGDTMSLQDVFIGLTQVIEHTGAFSLTAVLHRSRRSSSVQLMTHPIQPGTGFPVGFKGTPMSIGNLLKTHGAIPALSWQRTIQGAHPTR